MTPIKRKELRARAHALKPVILVGDAGLSDAVLAETDRALYDHELIKVRLPGVGREVREQMTVQLCEQLGAQQVQAIGHIQVIFRANPAPPAEPEQARKVGAKTRSKRPSRRAQK